MESSFLWHTQEADSVARELKADLEQGLSNKEAESRLAAYGLNELPEKQSTPWSSILLSQQISLMIPILVLAAVILILTDLFNGALVVIGVLVISLALSFFQEIKSRKVLRHLRRLANTSMYARVLRSGSVNPVKATDLVPGDILCFEAGDRIAADGRLVEADQLAIDETVITEATKPVEKDPAPLGEDVPVHQRKNMVFMGTMVTGGHGRAIVTSTGTQTQLARMPRGGVAGVEEAKWSLLEANLSKRGLWFAGGCIAASAILWVVMTLLDVPSLTSLTLSLSFLMAAWPMGLIEAVTMALTIGMKRLSERNIVIRKFSGAETLAGATVICSDKNGIMTQRQMTVRRVFVDGRIIDVEGNGYDPESGGFPSDAEANNPDLPLLLTVAAMCANTEVKNTAEGWRVIGDPVEGALIVAAMKGDIDRDDLSLSLTKVAEIPLDSQRKRMSVVFRSSKDEIFVFTRGSLETVLDICSNLQLHGYVDSLDVGRQRAVWAVNQSFARDGMQSMTFAYCQLRDEPQEYNIETAERNLVFVGMMGIDDPLSEEVKPAVQKCLDGAVETIMITDDYVVTAFAVARELQIAYEGAQVLTGEELDILGEKEYSGLAERFSVYADISPAHKVRIVHTLKEKGEVVAVIGEHTTDAPAVREADLGIAAGKTASSVTIDASDIVLMDNSFASAVDAIEGMRGAYGNAKRVIRYLLSGSAATAGIILVALIISIFRTDFSLPSSYSFHQIFLYVIWVNLLAGGIPALAIALNPVSSDMMKDGPFLLGRIFDDGLKSKIPIRAILTIALVFIAFAFSLGPSIDHTRAITAAFTVLVISQFAFAFQCRRTPDEGFFRKFFANRLLLGLILLLTIMHISIIYVSPISRIFKTQSLMLTDWIPVLAAFVICSLPFDELFGIRVEGEEEEKEEEHDEELEEDTAADLDEDVATE